MKYEFKRRRAIKCEFVEKSKTSPGYLKYEVTICEKDGTIHKQPAYGIDMQSAIARLVNQERTVQIEKKVFSNPLPIALLWIAIMAWPAFFIGVKNTCSANYSFCMNFFSIIHLATYGHIFFNYNVFHFCIDKNSS